MKQHRLTPDDIRRKAEIWNARVWDEGEICAGSIDLTIDKTPFCVEFEEDEEGRLVPFAFLHDFSESFDRDLLTSEHVSEPEFCPLCGRSREKFGVCSGLDEELPENVVLFDEMANCFLLDHFDAIFKKANVAELLKHVKASPSEEERLAAYEKERAAFKSKIEILGTATDTSGRSGQEFGFVFFKYSGADFTHLSECVGGDEFEPRTVAHGLLSSNVISFPPRKCPICGDKYKLKEQCPGFNGDMSDWVLEAAEELRDSLRGQEKSEP